MEKIIYTPKEASDMLNIGMNKTYELLKTNKIRAIREGRRFLIPAESIKLYLRNGLIDETKRNN